MAEDLVQRVKDISLDQDGLPIHVIVQAIQGVGITLITNPNQPNYVAYDSELESCEDAIGNLCILEQVLLHLFRQGDSSMQQWWRIILTARLFVEKYPDLIDLEANVALIVYRLLIKNYIPTISS